MQLSFNWLKDYVHIPKSVTPADLAARLTLHTVEVEGVLAQSDSLKNIVVGKILKVEKHPNADRLRLVKADIGTQILPIVCGADNILPGQFVPVALPGAILPNGMEIKEAEVRGEISKGMLCAEDELGLGPDHSGIMILAKAKLGTSLAAYLKLDDTILEVDNKSLTNRPDLWSHLGMARDISAILKVKLSAKAEAILASTLPATPADETRIDARVDDETLCPRYMAAAMKNVKVGPSPDWMRSRLSAAGMRPINNIVDITNFVMLELGQPLHAFDLEKIAADPADGIRRIVIRRAEAGGSMETLDLAKRELDSSMLMIADASKPLAVAGVMGGLESEINQDTQTIIFESANFNPVSVRKTASKLGLRTESSMRFEKSLDPNLCETALARAISLTAELCPGAAVSSRIVDRGGPRPAAAEISLNLPSFKARIGADIETRDIVSILERLGFSLKRDKQFLSATVPSWRAKDITLPEDILEEVIRIYGYSEIVPVMPETSLRASSMNRRMSIKREIRDTLVLNAGFSETYNYSFVGADQLKKLKLDHARLLKLLNPLASNSNLLRESLAPNLFECVKKNQSRSDDIRIFEIGSVYLETQGELPADSGGMEFLPYQDEKLGLVMAGSSGLELFSGMKGAISSFAARMGLDTEYLPADLAEPWSDSIVRANVMIDGKPAGYIARLDPKIGRSAGIKKESVLAELSLNIIEECADRTRNVFQEFEKYPPVIRDLAIVVDAKAYYADIRKAILGFGGMLKKAELFDSYEGQKVGHNKKSLAFHIIWQADRTLKSEEVDEMQAELLKVLDDKFGAKLRDF